MSPYINTGSNNSVVLTTAKQINLYWNSKHILKISKNTATAIYSYG